MLFAFIATNAQKETWLQRSWPGKAYLLGSNPKSYNIVLTITNIKGKKFDGVIKTLQTDDESVSFNSQVTGTIYDRNLQIRIGPWKVECNTCKPQTLTFSIESGSFFLKGEADGCTVECTWITEFSNKLNIFTGPDKDLLFEMADVMPPPEEPDTVSIVENTPPPRQDTVVAKKVEQVQPEQRIPVLPSGNIVVTKQAVVAGSQPLFTLKRRQPWLVIKANMPPPEEKFAVLQAGNIVQIPQPSFSLATPPNILKRRQPWLLVKANTPPPEEKFPVLQAGNIVQTPQPSFALASPPNILKHSKPGLTVKENKPPVAVRIPILPAGNIVQIKQNKAAALQNPKLFVSKNLSLTIKQNPLPPKPPAQDTIAAVIPTKPAIKDTASLLPPGFAERKINVMRSLTVDTDSITLRVYDNGVVDGDIVSVIYNNQVVIDKLSLTSHAVEVKLPVKSHSVNKLLFYAHNLGEFPPNTALLEIHYGEKSEQLTVSSDLTMNSGIDIISDK